MLLFLAYLSVYYLGFTLSSSTQLIRGLFLPLHLLFGIWAGRKLFSFLRSASREEIIFWSALSLFLLLPGAYLEYPSDAWEHLRRIFTWSAAMQIGDGPYWFKFAYFWNWSFLSWLPIGQRYLGVDLLNLFWQMLLAVGIYRLSLRLGFEPSWSRFNVFATACLFGTNLFGFFRVYALSSTPLAYGAYLAALEKTLGWENAKNKSSLALQIGLLGLIMLANHKQELLFLGISTAALTGEYASRKARQAWGRKGLVLSAFLALAVLALFILCAKIPDRTEFAFSHRIFRFGSPALNFRETVAIPGVMCLICGLLAWPSFPKVGFLLFAPFYFLLIPQFDFEIVRFSEYYTTYRALFSFPTNFGLTALAIRCFQHFPSIRGTRGRQIGQFLLYLLCAVIPARAPFRGRFWFQVYRPSELSTLKIATPLLIDLSKREAFDPKCLFFGDAVTQFLLTTHFQVPLSSPSRIGNPLEPRPGPRVPDLGKWAQDQKVCGFLFRRNVDLAPPSLVGELSHHWDETALSASWRSSPDFLLRVQGLSQRGWRIEEIPPFFLLATPR